MTQLVVGKFSVDCILGLQYISVFLDVRISND